jgi:hypothetical protein
MPLALGELSLKRLSEAGDLILKRVQLTVVKPLMEGRAMNPWARMGKISEDFFEIINLRRGAESRPMCGGSGMGVN